MADKVILNLTAGPLTGKILEFLDHDTLVFGRMDDCHICIPDDNYLSRHHFLLEVNPPDARIRDLGSLNGTYVNGRKVGGRLKNETPDEGAQRNYPQVDLYDGDEIKTGDTCFHVKTIVEKPAAQIIHCERCGKDVTAEVTSRREGNYLCRNCIKELDADPDAILQALFNLLPQSRSQIQIPDYEIVKLLGKGGMGEVFQIRHKTNGTFAALKLMVPKVAVSAEARDKFFREIQTSSALYHPKIVQFISSGVSGSIFYLIMEYCNRGNLLDLMNFVGRPLTENETLPLMLQVLDGLAYAHLRDIVHRDLKPQNILLTKENSALCAKIGDFGLSKNFTQAGFSGMTITGTYSGSYPFMPREQVTNFKYVKPFSDVWSIAATFYYVLTGELPRDLKKGQDPLEVILSGKIIPIRSRKKDISCKFAEVIERSLSNQPKDRYPDAGEMKKDLEKIA
jgi:hypothetical protein